MLGGAPVKLRDNVNGYFAMAPDDRRVAFVRQDDAGKNRSLIVSSLDGASETVLATLPAERNLNSRSVAWSPDGSIIAVSASLNDSNETIFLVHSASGELTQLAPKWRDISRVVWLKDGSGLLTIAAGTDPNETPQVWFVAYPRGEARRITNDLGIYDIGLSVGLDPKSFLLVQQRQMTNLWVAPADDFSKAKQLTFQSFNPSFGNFALDWVPGNRIVYATTLGRGPSLWVMDPDGQNNREITPPGNGDQVPSASGDGRFIVFASKRSGADEIWRADIDGGNAKQLTTCGKNSSPNVSRDGRWVVYVSGCDGVGTLWRVSAAGGQPLRLTDRPGLTPWVSPDSKWIACGYKTESNKWQLAIIPIEGGPPARLFDVAPLANFSGSQRWTPDGKAVTYRDWRQGLWRQAITGGPPQQIPGLPEEKFYGYDWSRDGKLFAFTRGVEIRDVVLISNSN